MAAFPLSLLSLLFFMFNLPHHLHSTTFTVINNCPTPIWPATLTNSGSPPLSPTGFLLSPSHSLPIQAPTGWSGRFWARTACTVDPSSDHFSCTTGDCGSNQVECNGNGASPPATLAEFTLAGPTTPGKDFYDVSLVDGYNLPVLVESANCGASSSTGCVVDLNPRCPAELRVGVGEGQACRSACEAFGKPEYCCSGEYGTPATCRPTVYSEMFKLACPRAYTYAYDDATSTFTCTGGDYTITFCPDSTTSQKSSREDPTTTTSNYPPSTIPAQTTPTEGKGEGEGGIMLEDAWLASLATGGAASSSSLPTSLLACLASYTFIFFIYSLVVAS